MDTEKRRLTHLRSLEAESIHVLREAVAEFENPVMLYSIGKDSSVMLRLAEKAFAPAPLPFPLMHIDTTWKFRDMIAHRDRMAKEVGAQLIVHTNADGVAQNINPFDHGSNKYTTVMKTDALKQALSKNGFDCAFGGARRDEERSRAKERIFSFRDRFHQWDPKNQRPELWSLYNTRTNLGESVRVFPLSNWTELDVWLYIHNENIPIVPLYFAKWRPVVSRHGHAHHGRRQPDALRAGREAGGTARPLSHARLLPALGRDRVERHDDPADHQRDAPHASSPSGRVASSITTRTRRWRPRSARVLLMASDDLGDAAASQGDRRR